MAAEHRVPRLVLLVVEFLLAIEPADRGGLEDHFGPGHRREPRRLGIPLFLAGERAHLERPRLRLPLAD
ncbi:MAG: hypothetical protein ACKOBP_06330, partial [Planctomycetia bacterium]